LKKLLASASNAAFFKKILPNLRRIIELKVAPYSFTIARALRMKAQVICALEGKRQCFWIFSDVNMSTKSKTDSEFSRVSVGKIRKIWQIGSKYFTLV